ncbi:MAG: hypothetical protein AB1898_26740 [Acidobacteriota bacterium]
MAPLCDWLFDCGCTWLWSGAGDHCNIHHPAPPHCPWCSYGNTGFVLSFLGLLGGTFVSAWVTYRFTGALLLALLVSGIAVVPVGLILGWVTVQLTGYPLFVVSR